jgi:hypothetical protein
VALSCVLDELNAVTHTARDFDLHEIPAEAPDPMVTRSDISHTAVVAVDM